jgi:hypothetical protein
MRFTFALCALLAPLLLCTADAIYSVEADRRRDQAETALAEIRRRQGAYRSEFGQYANATEGAWVPEREPAADGTSPWPSDHSGARALGFEPEYAAVPYQVQITAGPPGQTPPGESAPANDHWYVARVRGHFESADTLTELEALSWRP